MKLPHVNKKTTTERANFCSNTVFSTLKLEQKIHAATSKIKISEQIKNLKNIARKVLTYKTKNAH